MGLQGPARPQQDCWLHMRRCLRPPGLPQRCGRPSGDTSLSWIPLLGGGGGRNLSPQHRLPWLSLQAAASESTEDTKQGPLMNQFGQPRALCRLGCPLMRGKDREDAGTQPPDLQGIYSDTSHGCLKPPTAPNPCIHYILFSIHRPSRKFNLKNW